ncbi:MAG: hypothetical protein M5T61_20820 [Acidimicrobiia bacterium]|nr:hypothetical protein [Acidimicrobiia bacterium]
MLDTVPTVARRVGEIADVPRSTVQPTPKGRHHDLDEQLGAPAGSLRPYAVGEALAMVSRIIQAVKGQPVAQQGVRLDRTELPVSSAAVLTDRLILGATVFAVKNPGARDRR